MHIELRISGVDSIPGSLSEVEEVITANMSCNNVQKITARIKAFSPVKEADQEDVKTYMGINLWKHMALGSIKNPIINFERPFSEDKDSYELVVTVEKAR